jgi:hypothetical protein
MKRGQDFELPTVGQCGRRQAVLAQDTVSKTGSGRSRNHCCSGKTISITYSGCVSVALVIRHAKRTFSTWSVRLYHIYFHIIS